MKCYKCGVENKEEAKFCKKCSAELSVKQVWRPDWKWHAKTLAIIYASLAAIFFLLNLWLGPYMRKMPADITPWLGDMREGVKKEAMR